MDNRAFLSGAAATPPTNPSTISYGYPSDGNPATGTPATVPGSFWAYQFGEELRNVIVNTGQIPNTSDLTQIQKGIERIAYGSIGALVPGFTRNLISKPNATTPNSKADINADAIILGHSTLAPILVSNVDLTVDLTTTGVNALDTGTKTNNTWYALYVISNGTTVAGLASLSFSAPALPSGYVYYSHVGQVRINGSGNIVSYYQVQKNVGIARQNVLNNGQATTINTFQALSISNVIPVNANFVFGVLGTSSAETFVGTGFLRVASTIDGIGQSASNAPSFGTYNNGLTPPMYSEFNFICQVSSPQTLYWAQSIPTSPWAMIDITGYDFA